MSRSTGPTPREERLAAKLRENLRRRKEQARALEPKSGSEANVGSDEPRAGPEQSGSRGLSKIPPKS